MTSNNLPTQLGDDTTLLPPAEKIEIIDPENVKNVGSGDTFLIPGFLNEAESEEAFKKLLEEIPFQQWYHMPAHKADGACKPLSRVKCALATPCANNLMPHYRFPVNDQNRYPVLPITAETTPTLYSILQQVNTIIGVDYNHVVVLLYRDGNDAIGPHKDKTLDLDESVPIVSISLGAKRPYMLRENDIFKPTRTVQFDLPNGALLCLGPKTNNDWFHSIIMLPGQDVKPRISLTFRKTLTFRNTLTGEISGKGVEHSSPNWPKELLKNHHHDDQYLHRFDQYLEAPIECADILTFWFGKDATEYRGGLWWRGMMENTIGDTEEKRKMFTDNYISRRWSSLVTEGLSNQWLKTVTGQVGAIIVNDQLTRHVFRGTARAFSNDYVACVLANELLDKHPQLFSNVSFQLGSSSLIWTFQIFVYFALIHSENLSNCERGVCGMANLYSLLQSSNDPAAVSAANRVAYLFRSSKQHLQVLLKFKRYPHRNITLGRENTQEELEFLKKNSHIEWQKSQLPPVKSVILNPTANAAVEKPKTKSGFRLLVLHSNRQSVLKFQQRTRHVFSKLVGEGGTLIYAQAPHKYEAKGEARNNMLHLRASQSPNTRCWWNASDRPEDMTYDGIEDTIIHLDKIAQKCGPFDGIIGFSQGGAVAGLMAALACRKSPLVSNLAKSLQFVIIISGFYVRDTRPEYRTLNGPLATEPVNIPSFHVWGKTDALVTPDRSKALRDSFATLSNNVPMAWYAHELDHYSNAVAVWPVNEINTWIHAHFKPRAIQPVDSLADALSRIKIGQAIQTLTTIDEKLANALQPLNVCGYDSYINQVSISILDHAGPKPTANMVMRAATNLVSVVNENVNNLLIDWDAKAETILLFIPHAISSFYIVLKSTSLFHKAIVKIVSEAIKNCLATKTENVIVTALPNYKNSFIKQSGIVEEIISQFPEFNVYYDGKNIDKTATWKNICNAVAQYVIVEKDPTGDIKRQEKFRKGMRNADQLERLLNAPFSDDVINPRAEPVQIAQQDEFRHLHEFLRSNASSIDDAAKVFPRGTLTPDHRLDLCKRELGSAGVPDLEISLEADGKSACPKVHSLLLGNNVAGKVLGEAVGRMIKKKSTAITTWYIAGNDLDAQTILPVMEALEDDDQVTQLWLKRNPLKPAGALSMVPMLQKNRTIVVLDLTNTGLLDSGTLTVFNAIASNKQSTIEYIYLESNGITRKSIPEICQLLPQTHIKELCLSGNRVGDDGAILIANVMNRLEHLKLSSCGIGSKGAMAIATALANNVSLKKLDLGFLKSTNVLGEVPNAIGNQGAIALADALKTNKTLISLVVLHNGIYQDGVAAFARVLSGENTTLLHLNVEQLGIPHNEVTRESIRISLARNLALLTEKEKDAANALINNLHLSGIKSVYRNESKEQ